MVIIVNVIVAVIVVNIMFIILILVVRLIEIHVGSANMQHTIQAQNPSWMECVHLPYGDQFLHLFIFSPFHDYSNKNFLFIFVLFPVV